MGNKVKMSGPTNNFRGILLLLAAFAPTMAAGDTAPEPTSDGELTAEACFWGGVGEQTTYLGPYSPLLAPDIPVQKGKDPTKIADKTYPLCPEDAISVIGADGIRYSYYYKKGRALRKISEYRTVFEPVEEMSEREVETIDPCTGRIVICRVNEPSMTPYPVFHQKEFVRYEPMDVLIRVILPGKPTPEQAQGFLAPEGASTHFSSSAE